MISVPMSVAVSEVSVPARLEAGGEIRMEAALAYSINGDPYHGEYEFTPGDEDQTVATMNKLMTQNIRIKAIPSNYGKIGWNGSVLTVS